MRLRKTLLLSSLAAAFLVACLTRTSAFTASSQFADTYAWGTYKPQLVHAVTNMSHTPLTLGLMYYDPDAALVLQRQVRYKVCDRPYDDIIYDYSVHNLDDFAEQQIIDPHIPVNMRTTFAKVKMDATRQEWVDVAYNYAPSTQSPKQISIVYLVGLEDFLQTPLPEEASILQAESVGSDAVRVTVTREGEPDNYIAFYAQGAVGLNLTAYKMYKTPPAFNWNMYDQIFADLRDNQFQRGPQVPLQRGTLIALVFTYSVAVPFQIVAHFDTQRFNTDPFDLAQVTLDRTNQFIAQFDAVFKNTSDALYNDRHQCAVDAFTNLMSGLQYSYGNISCTEQEPNCDAYLEMFSLTPSRYGFPRPFLWDNGFHTIFSCAWRPEVCLQDLTLWLGTMSPQGWIPREQPRGPELKSYISWLKEDPHEANPLTFFWEFSYLVSLENPQYSAKVFSLLDQMESWVSWWNTSQGAGNNLYVWWGPDPTNNLGSGMDDWPRTNGDFVSKYNIDASCWMQFATNQLSQLYQKAGNDEKASFYEQQSRTIRQKIFANMYDPQTYLFYDLLHDGDVEQLSPHLGYPNFFPLALGMLDPVADAKILVAMAEALHNQTTIWSDFGVLSLSRLDPYFGQGSNYWRGPIWINIHYMVLRAIKLYYWSVPELRNVYADLRDAIVETVCRNRAESGYFYEIFNQPPNDTGAGTGNHPFNGWTSVITSIIAENYITGPNQFEFASTVKQRHNERKHPEVIDATL